ncbi:hypothetical protein IFM89_001278 [Coptis chinensis]|uniref:Uncharacterized protein n=1 Tax=Coptis chinensis TaxID=261450 RepID=A0A835LD30_9MAGN|nr:hypothetical protein IFM89_001278 [Coptis chinensis]
MSCLTQELYYCVPRECLKLIPHSKFSFAKIRLLVAQFEIRQKNIDGARKLLGNAIGRAPKDKAYIDFEISKGNMKEPHNSIRGYLIAQKHLKVWITLLAFEAIFGLEGNDAGCFENAVNHLRTSALSSRKKELSLLEEWLTMESSFGDIGDVDSQNKLREAQKEERDRFEDGPSTGYAPSLHEEYYLLYIFLEEIAPQNLKILDAAYKWKKQKFSHTEE